MDTEQVAELLGAHALVALVMLAAVMLAITAFLWHILERHSASLARATAGLLARARVRLAPHAQRLRIPKSVPRAWAIARRIGIQALLSLAVAIGALTLFFEIADEIGADEGLARFDEALRASLQRHASAELLSTFATLTHLGDRSFLIVLSVAVAAVLLWRRRWLLASAWIVATALGGAVNLMLKSMFERTRPIHTHELLIADGWSFPSGHAAGSFIVYSLLGYVLVTTTSKPWHIPATLAAVTLVVFVGFSRVILQVHFFSDVLAGYAYAATWVGMWIAGLEAARHAYGAPGARNATTLTT